MQVGRPTGMPANLQAQWCLEADQQFTIGDGRNRDRLRAGGMQEPSVPIDRMPLLTLREGTPIEADDLVSSTPLTNPPQPGLDEGMDDIGDMTDGTAEQLEVQVIALTGGNRPRPGPGWRQNKGMRHVGIETHPVSGLGPRGLEDITVDTVAIECAGGAVGLPGDTDGGLQRVSEDPAPGRARVLGHHQIVACTYMQAKTRQWQHVDSIPQGSSSLRGPRQHGPCPGHRRKWHRCRRRPRYVVVMVSCHGW